MDLGTGSGILAIAAAKLGYQPVHAIDLDAEAIRIARANARRNRSSRRIRFLEQDLTKLPRQASENYSVICANLISSLLLAARDRILTRLRGDGIVIIAGILKVEFGELQEAYEAAGMRLLTSQAEKEWRSGTFRWG